MTAGRGLALVVTAALLGCGDDDAPCPATWQVGLADDDGPLLAAWGRSADDAWLVGGGLGASGARLVRWTGTPTAVAIDRPETLWWGWSAPDGTVWLVGEHGLILRGDGTGPFTVVATGTDATLYGVWGSAADDVWIVGGIANQAADADDELVLRWDGVALRRSVVPARGAALFKVWGSGAGDVWLSGETGTLWRWDGVGFVGHHQPTAAGILTVNGCAADDVYAVGGRHVWHWAGAAWAELTGLPSFALAAGVACGADEVLVVGAQGLRLRRDRATGAWTDDSAAAPIAGDLHGAWAAPDGTLLAVGGDYLTAPGPVRRGLVAVRGCR